MAIPGADNGTAACCPPLLQPEEKCMDAYPPASSVVPEKEPLNYSSNILLVYRLNEMRELENLNFTLALLCLAYCGVNITLVGINYANSHNENDPPVSDKVYHLIEFWGTFFFAIVECVSLTSTPKSLVNIYDNTILLKLLLFFNIVATLLPALLVSLNLEKFEIVSHQVEYLNELTMSFVDLILLWSLCQFESTNLVMACIASVVAFVQLAVYNGMGVTEDGDMVGEVPAHYLEFVFEIISSLIAFWFCMDNTFVAAKEIGLILYGSHRDCKICGDNSQEFSQTYFPREGYSVKKMPISDSLFYGAV